MARHVLQFHAATITLGETASGTDGSYARAFPALDGAAYRIDAAYAGSDGRWPAAGRLFLQMVPSVAANGVVNAANYAGGAVSPGEIVTVFGELMGEPLLTTLELNAAGSLARELFNTRLLFDGIAAPLIYASSRQISAIVPYGVAGKLATSTTVEYLGFPSAAVQLPVNRERSRLVQSGCLGPRRGRHPEPRLLGELAVTAGGARLKRDDLCHGRRRDRSSGRRRSDHRYALTQAKASRCSIHRRHNGRRPICRRGARPGCRAAASECASPGVCSNRARQSQWY